MLFRFVPLLIPDKNIRIKQRHRKVEEIKIESSKKLRYNKREQKGTHRKGVQMVLVATQVKRRRGTTAENDAFTGAEGEITVDLTNKELRVHTGDNKVGGYGLARKDFQNLTNDAKNIANWSSNVSNCITEIPQDIKLELNNGTLTLKAGSKCYVKGDTTTPTFNITSDKSTTQSTDGSYFAFYDGTNLVTYSKSTYDYNTLPSTTSFPLAEITVSGGVISSIDQVFNGLGYIGSTIFALPNVKCLIPNGRNTDGTLQNIPFALSAVHTLAYNLTGDFFVRLESSGIQFSSVTSYIYNSADNKNYDNGSVSVSTILAKCSMTSGIINSLSMIKTAFQAVDYSDTEYIAHQAMPSNKYIDLTAGASGTTYTAPADGYFIARATAPATGRYLELVGGGIDSLIHSGEGSLDLSVFIPVQKGTIVTMYYSTNTPTFGFVYAQGSK